MMDDSEDDNVDAAVDYDELEEEFDLHVPVINDNDDVANGYHEDDAVEDSDDDQDDENEREIPIQPRIMLGDYFF